MGRRKNDELPSRLDRSTAEYLRNLEKAMYNNAISTEEQWESMLTSAFDEIKGIEYETCGDVVGSRVVERLLRYSVDQQNGHPFMPELVVQHFQELLRLDRYWDVFGDKYGSHVAQTLFELVGQLLKPDSELSNSLRTAMSDRLVEICDDLRGKWLELMGDCYASHVGRSLIQLLAGRTGDEELDAEAEAAAALTRRPELLKEVPLVADAILGKAGAAETAEVAQQVRDMGYGSYSVPILQLLMRVHPDTDDVAKRSLGWKGATVSAASECGEHITALLSDSAGSHLLETAIGALSDEAYYELYVTFFRGQLVELALEPVANFVVQQLFKHARQPAHVVSLVGEIAGEDNGAAMRRLFEGQRSSVVLAAAKACGAHSCQAEQRAMVKAVAAALDAAGGAVSSKFLEALLGLKESASRDLGGRGDMGSGGSGARAVVKKKRKRGNQKDGISSIGAQIIQAMLGYSPGSNLMLVQSFLAAPNHYLANLARLPAGSRLLEAFFSCPAHKTAANGGPGKQRAGESEREGEVAAARLQKFLDRFCAHHIYSSDGDGSEHGAAGTAAADEKPPQKRMRGRNRNAAEDDGGEGDEGGDGGAGDDGDGGDDGVNVLVSLAMDKFGSRVVEALYGAAELKRKRKIVGNLAACKAMLEADFHGRITLSKCRVSTFAAPGGEEEWAQREASMEKKRAMFADILEDDDDIAADSGSGGSAAGAGAGTAGDSGRGISEKQRSILGQLGVGTAAAAAGASSGGGDADELDELFGGGAGGGGGGGGKPQPEEEEVMTIGSTGNKKKKSKKEKRKSKDGEQPQQDPEVASKKKSKKTKKAKKEKKEKERTQ